LFERIVLNSLQSVQSRFAETRFAKTLTLNLAQTLTLTRNPKPNPNPNLA